MLKDFVKLDAKLYRHPKVVCRPADISEDDFLAAMGLWTMALSYVGREGGRITRDDFRILSRDVAACDRHVTTLVRCGFLDECNDDEATADATAGNARCNAWSLHNVGRYQTSKPGAGNPDAPGALSSTERSRLRREKLKAEKAAKAAEEAARNTPDACNGEATLHATLQATTEKRREREEKEEEETRTSHATRDATADRSPLSETDRAPIATAPSAVRQVIDRDPPPLSSRAPDPMIGAMFSEAVRAVTGAPHVVTNKFVWRELGEALFAHFPELTGGQHGAELRRLVPEWIAADRAGDGFAGKNGYQPKPFINWLNARAASEAAPEPPSRYKPIVPRKLDGPVVPPTEEFLATLKAMERGR